MAEVILVHGLWYRAWSLRVLAGRLQAAGFRASRFSYPTRHQDLDRNAVALAEYCQAMPTSNMHFIGHSLGGLVILRMLAAVWRPPPGRLVLLSTPLQGSSVARRSIRLPGGKFLLGKSARALQQGAPGIGPDRETGMIAGTRRCGLGRLTGGLQGANDGTVSVRETQADGLADRTELPVTHTGMLVSSAVAAQVAFFLSHGHFERSG